MNTLAKPGRTLWPLPGGAGNYLSSLHWILLTVERTNETSTVVSEMMEHFNLTSAKAAKSYLRVPNSLGLIDLVGRSVYLTADGQTYLRKPSTLFVQKALTGNIQGCGELLIILRSRPLRIGKLLQEMQEAGHGWTTDSQLRYRLRWLEEVGAVERLGQGHPEYRLVDDNAID